MTYIIEFKSRTETWRNADEKWLVIKESCYVDGINIVGKYLGEQEEGN
jgi:hypothetical protein